MNSDRLTGRYVRTGNQTREISMAEYVDGFVVPVKKDKVDEYREMAGKVGAMYREFGALDYKECVADDVEPGKVTSFPRSVNLEDDEVVVFSWITYESKAKRDEANAKVMADSRMKAMMEEGQPDDIMDPKRMFFGGFEVIVDA
jgi:uncharacterized protein YbaA (DUF1428 family)